MLVRRTYLVLGLAMAAALAFGGSAEARQNRGGSSKARTSLMVVEGSTADGAKARIRLQDRRNGAEFRVDLHDAPLGLSPELWVADAGGVLVLAGEMGLDEVETSGAEYRFRVRTDKGDALPTGATTLAGLEGRAIEIRNADGEVLATGAVPALGTRTRGGSNDDGSNGRGGRGRGRGSDDGAGDDHGGRGRGGRGGRNDDGTPDQGPGDR